MGKFKMRFKLTGLEIEIEGDRQDASQLTNALSAQLGGILAPASNVVALGNDTAQFIDVEADTNPTPIRTTKPKRKPSSRQSKNPGSEGSEALDWRNDIARWGSPKISWSTADKSLWLLYVVTQQTEFKELSAGTIAASFNKHFRQAGVIRPSNVSRDFGNYKAKKTPAWVNEDTTANPSKWYLTTEGIKAAEALVLDSKGEAA